VFTEPAAVRSVNTVGRFVFVATDNDLERWDEAGGVLAVSQDHGRVVALASDPDRHRVWILSDSGLAHYDASSEDYVELAAPPGIDFADIAKTGASIAPAADGGVFLGTQHGLVYATETDEWTQTSVRDPIRAMVADHDGWLWLATKTGLVVRKPTGDIVRVGTAQGCAVVDPRLIVELPSDEILVIGADDAGRERLAFGKQMVWTSYRALPEVKWDAAVRRGNDVVAMGGERVYRIAPLDPSIVRPLSRDGVRLVPLATGAPSDWGIDPINLVVPPGATTLGAADGQLLIGTRDLGTARYRDGDPHPKDWLRRKQMFEDATGLTVACAKIQDCWVATGARQAWHWTGDRFVLGGPAEVVLAVVRDPAGAIYALHRRASENVIHLARIDGTAWTPLARVQLATPGDAPELSFAKFGASGSLWVGLRYREGGEQHPYGVAVIDTATGKVAYHRADDGDDKIAVPNGVVDADIRGSTAWFVTNEGVARLASGKVKLWTDIDMPDTAVARAVTIAVDGSVLIATAGGVGIWDGKTWDFPPSLRFDINDLVATRNGQVWMATERGIAAWDGKKVRRIDTRRGLAENEVLDVAVDQFDRVWARGPGSLTLISQ
jgi:ligand-binding sensor domain-containing protein